MDYASLAPNARIAARPCTCLAPNGRNAWCSRVGRPDQDRGRRGSRRRRLGELRQARKGLGRVPLDREDAGVSELEPEGDGQLGEHLPRLLERLGDRYRRAWAL